MSICSSCRPFTVPVHHYRFAFYIASRSNYLGIKINYILTMKTQNGVKKKRKKKVLATCKETRVSTKRWRKCISPSLMYILKRQYFQCMLTSDTAATNGLKWMTVQLHEISGHLFLCPVFIWAKCSAIPRKLHIVQLHHIVFMADLWNLETSG